MREVGYISWNSYVLYIKKNSFNGVLGDICVLEPLRQKLKLMRKILGIKDRNIWNILQEDSIIKLKVETLFMLPWHILLDIFDK